jgi:poly(hydroxyalkanoate) depolymerase family esterase
MTTPLQARMIEATRLTRAGRLNEAMAVIRGALAGDVGRSGSADAADAAAPSAPLTVDVLPPSGFAPPRLSRVMRGLAPAVGRGAAQPLPPGARFDAFTFANAAGSRAFKLYIPASATGQPMPLIVMLHGCTQSPDDFAAGTRMNALAERHGFLVAYPEQPQSANPSRCWNWFNAGDQRRDVGEPSLIAGITRAIVRDQPVDPARIYVAGLSAGGAAAAVMGATYPDLYAAIGVHSGLPCGAAHDVASAFAAMQKGSPPVARLRSTGAAVARPTIVFHGDGDTTVAPVNSDRVIAQSQAGADLRTRVSRGKSPGGMQWRRVVHVDDADRTVLEQWTVYGAGHAWSGGSAEGSFTEPRGPDASAEMVRFFLSQR